MGSNCIALVVLMSLVAGCGDGGSAKQSAKHRDIGGPIDVAGVNRLVPAGLKKWIVFEEVRIHDPTLKVTFTLAAPKGRVVAGRQEFFSGFVELETKCHSGTWRACAAHTLDEWRTILDSDSVGNQKIVKDDRASAGRRVVVVDNAGSIDIQVMWALADDGWSQRCEASLDPILKDAAAAFEKACSSVVVEPDD